MAIESFEDLEVWKAARQLKLEIRILAKELPADEKYRLADQIIRCSRSIGAQLAEGYGRRTVADRRRFALISRGSLSELRNHLIDALDEAYIPQETFDRFADSIQQVSRLLNGYIKWLDIQANKE